MILENFIFGHDWIRQRAVSRTLQQSSTQHQTYSYSLLSPAISSTVTPGWVSLDPPKDKLGQNRKRQHELVTPPTASKK